MLSFDGGNLSKDGDSEEQGPRCCVVAGPPLTDPETDSDGDFRAPEQLQCFHHLKIRSTEQ